MFLILGASVNETFQVTLQTNMNYTDYQGMVSFFCVSGSSRFSAFQQFNNFICSLNASSSGNASIYLIARHNPSGEELSISNTIQVRIYGKQEI
jgi:hypothetical protein